MARNLLPYRLECCTSGAAWEVIAAFNCERAALAYGDECAKGARVYSYRATYRGKVTHSWNVKES